MAKALSILLLSSTKYLVGIVLAASSMEEGSVVLNYLFNIIGGILGIIFFIYFGSFLKKILMRFNWFRKVRKFSWKNRTIVKVRRAFGVPGIAFITPVVLSIPLGIFVALTITSNKRKILLWTTAACIFWSSVFFVANHFFGFSLPF
jgi:hypothetical protein